MREKNRRIDIRLTEEEYLLLKGASVEFGGISGWVVAHLNGSVHTSKPKTKEPIEKEPAKNIIEKIEVPVIKTKEEAIEAVKRVAPGSRPAHALNCSCFSCKPPKEK